MADSFDLRQFRHWDGSRKSVVNSGVRRGREADSLAPTHIVWSAAMTEKTSEMESAVFGFRQVAAEEKQALVNEVFSKVASRYDQMNDLMSGGLHRLWKDDLAAMLNPPRGEGEFRVLDVAGGTGDVAFYIMRRGGRGTKVTIADASPEMVAEGRKRAEAEGYGERCSFMVGNAEALAFPDKSFDAYTIAFGLRNVTHIEKALREAHRVLKPGGRFLCMEFSHMQSPVLKRLYDAYSFTVIPAMGKVVTGDGQPYRYLVESIRTFPDQKRLAAMIAESGLERVQCRNLVAGIVAVHSAWRL
jgi:demethylmenaquinone methyltransferase/2-methoxy-6-polyprenyl-1,4-benzoquinol methylase